MNGTGVAVIATSNLAGEIERDTGGEGARGAR
jgi:hypothetical protein